MTQHFFHFGILLVSILAIGIRLIGLDFISEDMDICLLKWFHIIQNGGGFACLSSQVGDYGLLYQTIISLLSYTDINPLYGYKFISIAFDFVLAWSAALIISRTCYNCQTKFAKNRILLVFGIVLLLPTVVMNSSVWGQCDSMYSSFCLLSIYFLQKRKHTWLFIFLGLALSCKLQTIFLLPFLGSYYFKHRKLSELAYFIIPVFVLWFSGIVAFLYGRNWNAPFEIYSMQTSEYHALSMNFPSFWFPFNRFYDVLKTPAIIITLLFCLLGFWIYVYKEIRINWETEFIWMVWFVWTVVLFLPCMHERYAYLLELLLVLISCVNKRFIKYCFICLLVAVFGYCTYLWKFAFPFCDSIKYLLFGLGYISFSYEYVLRRKEESNHLHISANL